MSIQRTFAMIKPDAYKAGNLGKIISIIEDKGYKIIHARLFKFTEKSAAQFYEIHLGQPYYNRLIQFTISDKVMGIVLEKENAIDDFRKLIGKTQPSEAENNSIRKLFGKGLPNNAIHGSDSIESAKLEITYIFGEFASRTSEEKTTAKEY